MTIRHTFKRKVNVADGERRQAMSDYAHAISINPESPARQALEQAHDIMAFFNTDLMNP